MTKFRATFTLPGDDATGDNDPSEILDRIIEITGDEDAEVEVLDPPSTPRQVAYAQEGFVTKDGAWFVAIVTENEPGYNETTYTGDLDYCRGVAKAINEAKGFTAREVDDVTSSSFRAQQGVEDFLNGVRR